MHSSDILDTHKLYFVNRYIPLKYFPRNYLSLYALSYFAVIEMSLAIKKRQLSVTLGKKLTDWDVYIFRNCRIIDITTA